MANIHELIQTGDRTHHHDKSITLDSFKVMKTIVRRPVNPMPLLEELEDEAMRLTSLSKVF